ncbi:hypothetical protein EBB07_26895 [Paenibacillaceae bacterium]|nr:hypothetical protein EBB07_26895 [Paenibacillaceae bacterium]
MYHGHESVCKRTLVFQIALVGHHKEFQLEGCNIGYRNEATSLKPLGDWGSGVFYMLGSAVEQL